MVLAGGLDSPSPATQQNWKTKRSHPPVLLIHVVLLLRTRTCAAQQVAKSPETQPGPVPTPRHLLTTIHARTPLQNGMKPPAAASFLCHSLAPIIPRTSARSFGATRLLLAVITTWPTGRGTGDDACATAWRFGPFGPSSGGLDSPLMMMKRMQA
jgi:hypothetical protein